MQRLQKVLAAAGMGSRRKCEELIVAGRVEVDGRVVRELGTKVDPRRQKIRLDGTPVGIHRKVYYLVYKPPGVLSTNRDPSGRPRVIDLLPPTSERLFTVGRLDMSSEGLMLVTNDGELAHRLTHPRYGAEKTYQVLVAGTPSREALTELTRGVHLAEGSAAAKRLNVKTRFKGSTLLEMVLDEGRNREIRRLMARVGHKVLKLKRVAIGRVRLHDLEPGQFRRLRNDELKSLRAASRPAEQGAETADIARAGGYRSKGPRRDRRGGRSRSRREKPVDRANAAAASPACAPKSARPQKAKQRKTYRRGKRS